MFVSWGIDICQLMCLACRTHRGSRCPCSSVPPSTSAWQSNVSSGSSLSAQLTLGCMTVYQMTWNMSSYNTEQALRALICMCMSVVGNPDLCVYVNQYVWVYWQPWSVCVYIPISVYGCMEVCQVMWSMFPVCPKGQAKPSVSLYAWMFRHRTAPIQMPQCIFNLFCLTLEWGSLSNGRNANPLE